MQAFTADSQCLGFDASAFLKRLMAHLIKRVRQREISTSQLGLFALWLDSDAEVPNGQWFKRFPEMIVCGQGELVKTFPRTGQIPEGEDVI